jgi:hypothetical protein
VAVIAYISNTRWPWCTETHVTQALTALGHTVTLLQEDRVTIADIEKAAIDSALLLYTRTWGNHDPDAMFALYEQLWGAGVRTASYHLDLYIGLEREATIPRDPFWYPERVFHPDGSAHAIGRLAYYGVNHHPLPPAVAASECFPGTRRTEFAHDVIFVGSARPYGHAADWPFRDQLVAALDQRYGPAGFAHYGPGGRRTVRNGIDGDPTALNDLYASARVVVGDTIDRDNYVSDRLTETLGRGGLLVFPRSDIVDQLGYIDGFHYLGYKPGDLTSALAAVDRALALSDTDRDIIRGAAIGQTFEHHTYTHRMATVLDVMGVR